MDVENCSLTDWKKRDSHFRPLVFIFFLFFFSYPARVLCLGRLPRFAAISHLAVVAF